MWSFIKEFLVYFVVFILICLITFDDRDARSFHQVNYRRKLFFNQHESNKVDYTKISTVNDYWKWLDQVFVPNLQSNRLIGWATMRQLRVKSRLCSNRRILSICQDDYSLFNEEKNSFSPQWKNLSNIERNYSSSITKAFTYQSNDVLDTYTYTGEYTVYSGNGYVYEFHGSSLEMQTSLNELRQLEWIDDKTRAVIIQMTLYNPNVQLFTSITFLLEILSSSAIISSTRFEPIDLYNHLRWIHSLFYVY